MEKKALIFFAILISSMLASVIVPLAVNDYFSVPPFTTILPFTLWMTCFAGFLSYGSYLLLTDKPDKSLSLKEKFDFIYARDVYPIFVVILWIAVIALWLASLGVGIQKPS